VIFIPIYLSNSGNLVASNDMKNRVEKLEIYHFHGINQCYSCKTVGAYAEETINNYFSNEIESGMIIFGHVNIDFSENRELVMRYGAKGSSLMIGVYTKDGFHAEEDTNVWYKINNKENYMQYLKGIIEQKLAGN